jgi:hypothetical protein
MLPSSLLFSVSFGHLLFGAETNVCCGNNLILGRTDVFLRSLLSVVCSLPPQGISQQTVSKMYDQGRGNNNTSSTFGHHSHFKLAKC